MNRQSTTQTLQQKPTATTKASGLLQRKCACGNHTMAGGECAECGKTKRFGLQTKLKVNEPGDIYEQEADRIADQVLAAPAHTGVMGAPPRIQRFSGQSNGQMDTAPASVDRVLASSGRPLEPALRQDMEQRFGHDFSRVRVHSGAAAEQSARDVNAHAYTVGHNVVFGAGRLAPGTHEGRHLIAHELTHVVQQGKESSTKIQRQPFGQRDRLHDSLLDDFSRETGVPRDRASQHSREYELWLQGRTDAQAAFDTHQLQPEHLSDSTVQNRFDRMTLEELGEYMNEYIANGANNSAVVTHITNLMLGRPVQPCSQADIQRTDRLAQAAVSTLAAIVNNADRAMTLLHSTWVNNKPNLLNRSLSLSGEVACAFKSNFNIDETNRDFGVAHIRVMSRLSRLIRRVGMPVTFACEGINNSICLGGAGLDILGFVVNHQSPIHLCVGFRESFDPVMRQTIILHEFLHFLAGVDDAGGYALGGFGAQTTSCTVNSKFSSATTDVLVHTADSLAGFIMHIEQTSPTDLTVR